MLVPFANAVHIKQIAVFYVIIVFIKRLLSRKGISVRSTTVVSFLVVMILQLLAVLRCNDEFATFVYLFAVMACVIYWSIDCFNPDQSCAFLYSYLLSFSIMAMFMIALTVKVVPTNQLLDGFVRLGEDSYFENTAFHTGANGLGMMCLFATSITCFLLSHRRINKAISLILIIEFIVTGIMTQSRAFLLGCVFLFLYLLLFYSHSIGRWLKIATTISVVASFAIILINHFYPNILTHYVERFFVDDITNGRADLLSGYFEIWLNDPISMIVGAGLHSYPEILGIKVGGISSHNATQEVMLAWGILGLIAIVVWIVSLVYSRGLLQCQDKKMRMLLPLFMLIFMVQSTRIFSTFSSIFLIGIAIFCITSYGKGATET